MSICRLLAKTPAVGFTLLLKTHIREEAWLPPKEWFSEECPSPEPPPGHDSEIKNVYEYLGQGFLFSVLVK